MVRIRGHARDGWLIADAIGLLALGMVVGSVAVDFICTAGALFLSLRVCRRMRRAIRERDARIGLLEAKATVTPSAKARAI